MKANSTQSVFMLLSTFSVITFCLAFKNYNMARRFQIIKSVSMAVSDEPEFDGKEFDDVFKTISSDYDKKPNSLNADSDSLKYLQSLQDDAINSDLKEELFRKFPYEDYELPILPDCNNYYSGKFQDSFWLQDADQVFAYIPLKDNETSRDIKVKFEALSVNISVGDREPIVLACTERLIPDGSFWTIETDKNGTRYLHLDMEKR